ncbi:TRAP transporter permease [Phreatobacter cathodiphilus]|uniref:C4-dicarboxylate ABC transporter n=1 Tax=Phreatobacter cathodiphilus TaxID=1868589 RepID=A0A2S0NDW3_9HYPH|nr:TRAP transporter permease [Phreatobacter cathodiphilus]AVO46345.1 C4-dicarboxylate ABC transporter [Phreatobacter cathodiphilus]
MSKTEVRIDDADDKPVVVSEEEFAGLKRTLAGIERHLFVIAAAGFTLYHIVVLNLFPQEALLFRATHVAWAAVLGFALYRPFAAARTDRIPWYDWILIVLSILCCAYIYWELDGLLFRAGALPDPLDIWVGLVGTLIVLEFSRRTAGLALPIIAGLFILYVFIGPWLPGVLNHRGFEWGRFFAYIYSDLGIFGTTTEASSNFIVLFVAFGAFLQVSKVGDYFNDLALSLFGHLRGGPAKATIASGVLFGAISGSSVANVAASGAITIPMMRRVGYDRATAGAVEATSSTGGQITPPILGAGAFLMAEITGIAYSEIAYAAIIPCVLFYVACFAHVELHARLHSLHGLPRSELPPLLGLLKKAYLFAPLVIMVWLLVSGYSAFRAGSLAIVSAIVVSWLDRQNAMGPKRALEALNMAARDSLQLISVCAAAGIIVGVIALTGIGGRFAQLLLQLAGENVLLAMLFTMVVALILGMGMPTTAAYAIGAAVLAPGLQRLGVAPLVAHMFIFYFAVVSAITPPVALASFAAAAIARADPWKTAFISVKMGLAVFIVPFMFFYSPLLLGQGTLVQILPVLATALIGVILLACATEGWFGRPIGWALRAPLLAAAILLIVPEGITDLIGLAIAAATFLFARMTRGVAPA